MDTVHPQRQADRKDTTLPTPSETGLEGIGPVSVTDSTVVELLRQVLENQAQLATRLDRIEKAKTAMPAQGYFQIKHAIAYTSLSDDYIRGAVTSGRLPVSNVGTPGKPLYLINKADLDAWLEKQKAGPQPRPRKKKKGQPEVRKLPVSRHYAPPPAA